MTAIENAVADKRAESAHPEWDDMGFIEIPADELPDPTTPFDGDECLNNPGLACTCAVGGGFLVTHAGCYVPPILAFMGVASGGGLAGPVIGGAVTATALAAWYLARGRKASTTERNWTVGGALAGTFMAATLHMTGVTTPPGHTTSVAQGVYNFMAQCRTLEFWQRAMAPAPAEQAHFTTPNNMKNIGAVPTLDKL